MEPIVLGALISGIVALATTAVSAGVSSYATNKSVEQSEKNMQLQKEFNSTQTLSSKIAEAKENGISPLAVLGQNASQAVVSAPQSNADYSGLSGFANSLLGQGVGFAREKYSVDKSTKSNEDIQRMKIKNAEEIANLEVNSNEKRTLWTLNNDLTIASNKNATDKEIQNNIRSAQHNLEMLKSSNAEFVQDKALKNSMDMLEKQLDNASKERDFRMKQQLVNEAFETFRTLIKSASNVFGGNLSEAVGNSSRSPMGF